MNTQIFNIYEVKPTIPVTSTKYLKNNQDFDLLLKEEMSKSCEQCQYFSKQLMKDTLGVCSKYRRNKSSYCSCVNFAPLRKIG